jgi:hypothetical protein
VVQYQVLGWPLKVSSGQISQLNAELIHFSWNLAVPLVVVWLIKTGLRNRWMSCCSGPPRTPPRIPTCS